MHNLGCLPSNWLSMKLDELATLAPVQTVQTTTILSAEVEVLLKREDLLSARLGGNKFYKLFYHLQAFNNEKATMLASFGGPHSNHIYSLAALGNELGIPTLGIIRGDYHRYLSPTLIDAKNMGMQLEFIDIDSYHNKHLPEQTAQFERQFPDCYWIPEGGAGIRGMHGTEALGRAIKAQFEGIDKVFCAAGTGATAWGIARGVEDINVCAILALKLDRESQQQYEIDLAGQLNCEKPNNLYFESRYHFGGYAKFPKKLRDFMQAFENQTKIQLDPVYTAKLMWAIEQQCLSGELSSGSKIVVVHSGGQQGRRGFDLQN